jgi:hypothetical protein
MKQIILYFLILSLISCSNSKRKKTESYEVGFKTIQTVDKLRLYKPDSDTNDYFHYRPLDIDIWYPAKISRPDTVLLFGNILELLEKRANYYTASDQWDGITPVIAQSICEGYECSDSTSLLSFKTRSHKNGPALNAKFPLVIYMCAFNGMSYENFALFEDLAEKGFVTASISSIGRYPGDMTMKLEDLFEQVNDAISSLNVLKLSSNIDFSKIAIIGYSWGGLSAAILATRIPNVSCLISLDGSEFHNYNENEDENMDFNRIRDSKEFSSMDLSMPYLRLESSPAYNHKDEDSVYNFLVKLSGEKSVFTVDSAKHEDFSCLSTIVRKSGDCKGYQPFPTIAKLILAFLEDHVKNSNSF